MVICNRCGDQSNSAPGLPCGRVDDDEDTGLAIAGPCPGVYEQTWLPQEAADARPQPESNPRRY